MEKRRQEVARRCEECMIGSVRCGSKGEDVGRLQEVVDIDVFIRVRY